MTLIERLKADQLSARKAKDTRKVTLLSTLIGEAVKVGKDNGNRDSTDIEVIAVIKKFKKNVEDTSLLIVKQNPESRNCILNSYKDELAIYDSYIPKQLSEEDLKHEIYTFYLNNEGEGDVSMKDVMAFLKSNFSGLYDGKLASQIANEILKG
jgi:uncharacterized protein YqeY